MKNPINWFELPVQDMTRAKRFYETVLDVEINVQEIGNALMGWFPFAPDSTGATGSLMKADSYEPSHKGAMVYFSVPEIDDVLAKVASAGGKVINPKFSLGEHGFSGHFEDSEGNRVGLHQALTT